GLVPYPEAVAEMDARVAAIAAGEVGESVWLLEHPPLYTAGVSAKPADLIDPHRLPVFDTGRGGRASGRSGAAIGSTPAAPPPVAGATARYAVTAAPV
ncbi:MAG: hypothetical protein ACTS5I_15705, partial [Rhodanobacter sp.]